MRAWEQLAERHRDLRQTGGALGRGIRARLRTLVERGHLPHDAPNQFSYAIRPGRLGRRATRTWRFRDGRLALRDVPGQREAHLRIELEMDHRTGTLLRFTAEVRGARGDGTPWVVALHLAPPEHAGHASLHSAFHCHVGPDYRSPPIVRVPLPAVPVLDALDRLLGTALGRWVAPA